MNTYTQIIYQIVFGTKDREHVLLKRNRPVLFKYIASMLENNKCHLYIINGVEDHIHIITHIHPTIALSNLVKNIKVASAGFIKKEHLFPNFSSWQEGYAAFTYSMNEKRNLIEYVNNQEIHHKKVSFKEELITLLKENHIEYDLKYLV